MDSLRSIAIIMVVTAHAVLGYGAPESIAPLQLGGVGVDLFFVLSGWLLGGALFREMDSGKINISRFWIRRWMRTLPAYYAILSLTIVQRVLTRDNVSIPLDYFFFLQNYHYPLEFLYVSWSLSVEEQFYLLIAPLLAMSIYLSPSYRLILLILALFIPFLFRSIGAYGNEIETHVRLDGCIFGVLLACIYYQHSRVWSVLTRFSVLWAILSLTLFILFFYQRWVPLPLLGDPGFLELAFIFGGWVVFANSREAVKYGFTFPGSYYIATRSYSLYLLHPEAIAILNRLFASIPFWLYLLSVFFFGLLISEVLYRAVEKPFMNMRIKLKYAR